MKKYITVYELKHHRAIANHAEDIYADFAVHALDFSPEYIAEYSTEKDALEALKQYSSTITRQDDYFIVNNYCVVKTDYKVDDDGTREHFGWTVCSVAPFSVNETGLEIPPHSWSPRTA